MITEQDLLSAIAECQGERNPNANTCMKLASYYVIWDHLKNEVPTYSFAAEPPEQVRYNSGSDFSETIRGKDYMDVLEVMDELMDTLLVLSPKLYYATLEKIKEI